MTTDIEVRPMEPADALGLSVLIRNCYGESYPKRMMYDPTFLAANVESHVYNGVVATVGNVLVGHIGYSWPNPGAIVVEAGTTVVDPSCRGAGLMGRLAQALRAAVVADGAVGFVHFPTTAHTVMQRASLSSRGFETGLMLAYLPADARDLTIGGIVDERLAVTVVYQPLIDAPLRAIFIPDRYRYVILSFANRLDLHRVEAQDHVEPTGATHLRGTIDEHRSLERITVTRVGSDIVESVLATTGTPNAIVVHVDLAMDDPAINYATEQLRRAGYVFAAWLPGCATSDVLRLQRINNPTHVQLNPMLYSAEANDIATQIRRELGEQQPNPPVAEMAPQT